MQGRPLPPFGKAHRKCPRCTAGGGCSSIASLPSASPVAGCAPRDGRIRVFRPGPLSNSSPSWAALPDGRTIASSTGRIACRLGCSALVGGESVSRGRLSMPGTHQSSMRSIGCRRMEGGGLPVAPRWAQEDSPPRSESNPLRPAPLASRLRRSAPRAPGAGRNPACGALSKLQRAKVRWSTLSWRAGSTGPSSGHRLTNTRRHRISERLAGREAIRKSLDLQDGVASKQTRRSGGAMRRRQSAGPLPA